MGDEPVEMEEVVPRKEVCGLGAGPRDSGGSSCGDVVWQARPRSVLELRHGGCCAEEQSQVALLKGGSISGGNQTNAGL